MQRIFWKGRQLSRLMLGTVQLGMPYGVANVTGQPEPAVVRRILEKAFAGGVNCLDTAAVYGESETVLGRELAAVGVPEGLLIVTKVRPLSTAEHSDRVAGERAVRESVAESRRRLGCDKLPLVLFHREEDAVFAGVLSDLAARGWLEDWGISCGNETGGPARLLGSAGLAAMQLPGNVLDHRHRCSGIFESAAARGVAVFVRSVFLQGLLLMEEERIPGHLRTAIPAIGRLRLIAAEAGMSLQELALRYVLSLAGVSSVLVGAETVQQVEQAIAAVSAGPLAAEIIAAVESSAGNLSEAVLTPALWKA